MSLDQLIGNRSARDALRRALQADRLPHALLLHGPPGVGKREVASALAQALVCPDAAPDACDRCEVCRRAAAGLHPDVKTIAPDGRLIKVDVVRDIVRQSYLRPFEGRAKVFVILDADRSNEEAANTLLKTLEEPPADTYLILVTSSRESVLPTLRSRCHAIEFHPLSRAELVQRLHHRHDIPMAEAELRARLAEGSESNARGLDLAVWRERREEALALLIPLAHGQLDNDDTDRLLRLAEALTRKDGPLESFLYQTLRSIARDALLLAAGGRVQDLVNVDHPEPIRALSQTLGIDGATALLAELDATQTRLVFNPNKKLLVESLLLGVYERARRRAPRG